MKNIDDNIIAAFIVSSENLSQAIEFGVTQDWFQQALHKNVFSMLVNLLEKNEWTPSTSANLLSSKKVFSKFPALDGICQNVQEWAFSIDDFLDALDVLKTNHITERVRQAGAEIGSRLSRFDDPCEVASDMINMLEGVSSLSASEEQNPNEIAEELIDIDGKIRRGVPVGLPFPWDEMQRKTFGIPFKAVSPLAGRDGKGKSRLATFLALQWAITGFPGLYFPFEDTVVRCLRNLAAGIGEYDAFSFNRSNTSDSAFQKHLKCIDVAKSLPIHFCDNETNIKRIISKIAYHKRKHRIRWVVIDGFKDIHSSAKENRTQEEVSMMRMLTAAARKYDVSIIPVMHLNKIEDEKWISKQSITGAGDQTKSARMVIVYQDYVPEEVKSNLGYGEIYDENFFILDAQKTSYGNKCLIGLIKDLERGRFSVAE